jgi:hypothetical protein
MNGFVRNSKRGFHETIRLRSALALRLTANFQVNLNSKNLREVYLEVPAKVLGQALYPGDWACSHSCAWFSFAA